MVQEAEKYQHKTSPLASPTKSPSPMRKAGCHRLRLIAWCKRLRNMRPKMKQINPRWKRKMAWRTIASPCVTRSRKRNCRTNLRQMTKARLKAPCRRHSIGWTKTSWQKLQDKFEADDKSKIES